jgi:hypothetical protein
LSAGQVFRKEELNQPRVLDPARMVEWRHQGAILRFHVSTSLEELAGLDFITEVPLVRSTGDVQEGHRLQVGKMGQERALEERLKESAVSIILWREEVEERRRDLQCRRRGVLR